MKQVTVIRFNDPDILKFYKLKDSRMICATTDKEAFEVVAYLKLSNIDFKATDVVRPKELKLELMKYCGEIKEMGDSEKSIFSLVSSARNNEEEEESWNSCAVAANYLFMAVSMINKKSADRPIGSLDSIEMKKRLVSLLWDSLSNLYDIKKMRLMVRTAVKYA